jgi:hypothetical protein
VLTNEVEGFIEGAVCVLLHAPLHEEVDRSTLKLTGQHFLTAVESCHRLSSYAVF